MSVPHPKFCEVFLCLYFSYVSISRVVHVKNSKAFINGGEFLSFKTFLIQSMPFLLCDSFCKLLPN